MSVDVDPAAEDAPVMFSSQAGLAALREGARRAGLLHGQYAPKRERPTETED